MRSVINKKEQFFLLLKGITSSELPFMPITMMYAADSIGQPYSKYATDAAVQTEAQLKIAEDFGSTHVSVISDPAVEACDHGAEVLFPDNAPPAIVEDNALLIDKTRLTSLKLISPESGKRMSNRIKAVVMLKEKVKDDLVVEGWVEGPCAEAADLRGINHLMTDFFDDADFVGDLMDFITEQGILFAERQIEAGADIIGIGDAASSLIGPELYKKFVLPRMKRYVDAIHNSGGLVRLHICGNTNPLFTHISSLDIDMIDLDSMASIGDARRILGDNIAIAGNIDPVSELKDNTPEEIVNLLKKCRKEAAVKYIVGAGCEVPRGTPRENLKAMQEFAFAQN